MTKSASPLPFGNETQVREFNFFLTNAACFPGSEGAGEWGDQVFLLLRAPKESERSREVAPVRAPRDAAPR